MVRWGLNSYKTGPQADVVAEHHACIAWHCLLAIEKHLLDYCSSGNRQWAACAWGI